MKYTVNTTFLASAFAFAVILHTGTRSQVVVGGWKQDEVDAVAEDHLMRVLKNASASSNNLVPSMCINNIFSFRSQVVAGMNYEYNIEGCNAESDSGLQKCVECTQPKVYVVLIYERLWENVTELTSITEKLRRLMNQIGGSGQDSSKFMKLVTNAINDEEKAHIADWISQNELNRYGDQYGTSYVGGNPLFNETSGLSIEYYDYMLDKFPTRPWRRTIVRAQSSVSNDNLQLMAETEDQSKWAFGVSAILAASVFVALVAMVMVVRSQRIQRRYAYTSISG
ncbi:unnamed protein product [Albugo candida]|uniref:Cystatin domain-containing protein n=1 Tax=Albugo candida TaxID=65357 RepID=A0A024G522_9STRA|nr:unnamed protein product [Albugo candida]|eukprot:CCI41856.1 unnamed protein product [Albugo candida]